MNLKSIGRGAFVAGVTAVLLATTVSAAHAEVSKSGTQSCPTGEFVRVHGYGNGILSFYWPDTMFRRSNNLGGVISGVSYSTGRGSTSWRVTSTDLLQDSGTYASCEPSVN